MDIPFLYLKILRKYGCVIYPNITVGRGFFITHPVGIVLGKCSIGENFMLYNNCTIGVRRYGEESSHLSPTIGNNVTLYTGSMILGEVNVNNSVTIGAHSIVLTDLTTPGTYVGTPASSLIRKFNI
jgi:serine O-acetyltransferase